MKKIVFLMIFAFLAMSTINANDYVVDDSKEITYTLISVEGKVLYDKLSYSEYKEIMFKEYNVKVKEK